MRKVVLTLKEQKKYDTIKRTVDTGGNKNRAAKEIGCTRRTVDRLIAGYKNGGKAFFSHKNKGRVPVTKLTDQSRHKIVDLYNSKYWDGNYKHFSELLEERESIVVSPGTVRNVLMEKYILSPRARRKTVRRVMTELESKKSGRITKKQKAEIERKLVAIEDAHPRRPRSANFGEELQMDASQFQWFANIYSHLHAAIDDATGGITGAYFDEQETLFGYYNVFRQTLMRHGIPYKFRTDRRTVFEYKRKNMSRVEDDTCTQFAYACKELGVHIESTSVPQGKARIERLWETLQGRLPLLLRLAGVTTIEAANEFLALYIDEFNAQFALDHNAIPSVFETQPSLEKINLTLAVLTERTVDAGHSIRFDKKYYRTISRDGTQINLMKGTKGLVVKAFDGNMFFSVSDTVMALEQIPDRERLSDEFSFVPAPKAKAVPHIPPPSHPWKRESFEKFCTRMRHRDGLPPAC